MAARVFDRETILDLMVNVIPLAILAFFFLAFVAFNPFGDDVVIVSIQLGIIGLMFVGLAAITYYSGAAVSKAEAAEAAEAAVEGTSAADTDAVDAPDAGEDAPGGSETETPSATPEVDPEGVDADGDRADADGEPVDSETADEPDG